MSDKAARRQRILDNSAARLEKLQAAMRERLEEATSQDGATLTTGPVPVPATPVRPKVSPLLPPLPPSPPSSPALSAVVSTGCLVPPEAVTSAVPRSASTEPGVVQTDSYSADLDDSAINPLLQLLLHWDARSLVQLCIFIVMIWAGFVWHGCFVVQHAAPGVTCAARVPGQQGRECPPSLSSGATVLLVVACALEYQQLLSLFSLQGLRTGMGLVAAGLAVGTCVYRVVRWVAVFTVALVLGVGGAEAFACLLV